MHAQSLTLVQLFVTPWTAACLTPPSMEFSRQECQSGLPFPTPGDLPDPGIEPMSLVSPALEGRLFTTSATWEALIPAYMLQNQLMYLYAISLCQFSSVAQSCLTLCNPMNSSMPGLPVYHQLLEFTQTHFH